MNADLLALAAAALASIPCALFLVNLGAYRPPPRPGLGHAPRPPGTPEPVSVLIPARNEERNIRQTVESVLANRGVAFEVVVLDDHSTDRTARIVRDLAAADPRLLLVAAPPLPRGWCGKQHACHQLAQAARHPLLLFLDADVRLAPDALVRMSLFMGSNPAALASGVPRQETGTFLERLLLPLIHFILLGFLPFHAMRRSPKPAFAAGCGQLILARRDAYKAVGGHAAIRTSLHDGLKLPRAFRRAGFCTDLFDAAALATCRMYRSGAEVWHGLSRNATEGLGAPGTLGPMTLLLGGGQVLPALLLLCPSLLSPAGLRLAALAMILSLVPRLVAAWRFRQPVDSVLLHPLGVLVLLVIQWNARRRSAGGRPSTWKGRSYEHIGSKAPANAVARSGSAGATRTVGGMVAALVGIAVVVAGAIMAAPSPGRSAGDGVASFELKDQFGVVHAVQFPRTNLLVLTVADHKGSDQIHGWVDPLKERYGKQVSLEGIADVSGVPGFLRGFVESKFRKHMTHGVMLDWTGAVVKPLACERGKVTVLVVDRDGRLRARAAGPASAQGLKAIFEALDASR